MANLKALNGKATSAKLKPPAATLNDIRDELRTANRLMVAHLALLGVRQGDIAGVIDKVPSVVSEMFPKGTLKRLSRQSKVPVNGLSE